MDQIENWRNKSKQVDNWIGVFNKNSHKKECRVFSLKNIHKCSTN